MPPRPHHVLFLCTGNSARSILGEVLLRDRGAGRFRAFSAGSRPAGRVHPEALACLARHGHATDGLRSKSWDEFAGEHAPEFDSVLTVCGDAAGETCPVWPGGPVRAHWGLPDPAAAPEALQRDAFETTYRELDARIGRLLELPVERLEPRRLQQALAAIGGAASSASPEGGEG